MPVMLRTTLSRICTLLAFTAAAVHAQDRDHGAYLLLGYGQTTVSAPDAAFGADRFDGSFVGGLGWRFRTGIGVEARTYGLAGDFTAVALVNGTRPTIGVDARVFEFTGTLRPSRLKFRGVQAVLSVGAAAVRTTDRLEAPPPRQEYSGTRIGGVGSLGGEFELIGGILLTGRASWRNVGRGNSQLPLPATVDGLGWDAGVRLSLW
jgi:hypothetical protein